ncbi:MAG: ATP synthase F0 subunit B [Candidatus Baltobacteraceae bacterium]
MFLSLDGTLWIQLINFGIFFLILNFVFLRPVGEAIRKRREYIEGVQADFERYTRQVQTLRGEADQKRAAARREAEEQIARARQGAESEGAKIAEDYGTQAQVLADQARTTVEGEVVAAQAQEDSLSKALGQLLLERAIGSGR